MRDAPSADLTKLLAGLGLVSPAQVGAVRRYAQSLARDLPLFDSVWVDALMRKRLLTPYQAAQINAGRGADLAVGPAVIQQPPERLCYADKYLSLQRDSSEQVCVLIAPLSKSHSGHRLTGRLREISEQIDRARQAEKALGVVPYLSLGADDQRLWAIQPWQPAITLRECLLRSGRMPGELVLEIARQLTAELADLEQFCLLHGDLSPSSVQLDMTGKLHLTHAGMRSVVRPHEGYAHAELAPEAYDHLAPERVSAGIVATVASDLYACGCLWWQLLTGRAPLAGGDSLTKIKAVHSARIIPIDRLAPEAPELLKEVLMRMVSREPASRGRSFGELAEELGPSQPDAKLALAEYLGRNQPHAQVKRERVTQAKTALEPATHDKAEPVRRLPDWSTAVRSRGFRVSTALAGSALLLLTSFWLIWGFSRGLSAKVEGLPSSNLPHAASGTPNKLSPQQIQDAKRIEALSVLPKVEPASVQLASAEGLATSNGGASPMQQFVPIRAIQVPANRILQATNLELHPGIRIVAESGKRAQIQVPPGGWKIDVDDVRLENIDFIVSDAVNSLQEGDAFFIHLTGSSVQFHGCSFISPDEATTSFPRYSAIHWTDSQSNEALDRLSAAGHVLLANCFLANLRTGVDSDRQGPVVLELDNVLFTAPTEAAQAGPVWRLAECPVSEDVVVLRMNACTVRDAMSLIDVYCAELPSDPGKLQVDAIDCVFAPRSTGSLFRVIGPFRPDRLMRRIAWGGRGSLLPIQGRFGLWYDAQGAPHALDDAVVEVDGLVRGAVEFAGQDGSRLRDSLLTHWAAPLIGDLRPGVHLAALPDTQEK